MISDPSLIAVVLWVLFAWLHDIATHSSFLVVTSRGYKLEWFTETFRRYLPPDNRSTVELPPRKTAARGKKRR